MFHEIEKFFYYIINTIEKNPILTIICVIIFFIKIIWPYIKIYSLDTETIDNEKNIWIAKRTKEIKENKNISIIEAKKEAEIEYDIYNWEE